jgi:hypothetical protein
MGDFPMKLKTTMPALNPSATQFPASGSTDAVIQTRLNGIQKANVPGARAELAVNLFQTTVLRLTSHSGMTFPNPLYNSQPRYRGNLAQCGRGLRHL